MEPTLIVILISIGLAGMFFFLWRLKIKEVENLNAKVTRLETSLSIKDQNIEALKEHSKNSKVIIENEQVIISKIKEAKTDEDVKNVIDTLMLAHTK